MDGVYYLGPARNDSLSDMKTICLFLSVTLLALTSSLSSAAPASDADEASFTALKKAVDDAYSAYHTVTNDVGGKLWRNYRLLNETNMQMAFDLAKNNPGAEISREMFSWVMLEGNAERGPILTNRLQSLAYLATYHATNSHLGPLCSYLGRYWCGRWRNPPVEDFLKAVILSNPDRAIHAQALYSLARVYSAKSEELADFEDWSTAPFYAHNLKTNDFIELPRFGSSQSAAAMAEQRFNEVLTDYADCMDLRVRLHPKDEIPSLKKLATQELFALQHLSTGKPAPEIETEGVDGVKFKLSDSRGKICVLNFWASWCGPCMQMVPLERALVDRMQGRPFSIIGVNGDPSLANAKSAMQRENMHWPSFWNGSNGPDGPVSSAWNVHGWPAIFVLDTNGIIRFKMEGYGSVSSNLLNGCVDELMKKMPAKAL